MLNETLSFHLMTEPFTSAHLSLGRLYGKGFFSLNVDFFPEVFNESRHAFIQDWQHRSVLSQESMLFVNYLY